MKSFKYIILFVIGGLLFSSCDDFLTVTPENNQSSDDFWNTKEEVEAVLGAGYVKLRNCQESFFLWGEARGNGVTIYLDGTDLQKAARKVQVMDILPTNKLTEWSNLYSVINMANSVLVFGPPVVQRDASFDENSMKSFAAEAYFQRSLAYFYLVRLWKDVPFVKDPYVNDNANYMLPQTDGDEILRQCLIDLNSSLENAKEMFPETDMNNQINTKGRATRWALYSLIADINLWLGNYDECIEACQKVIDSQRVGLIDGTLWFSNFYPGNSNESVFEIQYSKTLSQTNKWLDWFYTNGNYMISTYAQLSFGAYPNDIRGVEASYSEKYFRAIWKYIGINSSTMRNSSEQNDQNWIVYRLADILLMQAEAHIMKGSETDMEIAAELISRVRVRAGLTSISASTNQLTMLEVLLQERQKEFFAEGKNWFDMLRIGRRNIAGCKDLFISYATMSASANDIAMMRAKLADENSWYLPINDTEMKNNFELKQNPFYENLGN